MTSSSRRLARDLRLARAATPTIARTFRVEQGRVLAAARAGRNPTSGLLPERDWQRTLGGLWVAWADDLWTPYVTQLGGDPTKAPYTTQLTALVQAIIREGRPASQVRRFVEDAAGGIRTTSRRRITTVLAELEGNTVRSREVVRALARLYRTDFVATRAGRIALDNALRAAELYHHAAAVHVSQQTNRTYLKEWRNQGDDRVRATHSAAGGQRRPLDQPFSVGGSSLMYPREPGGPPDETYGCRCWVQHVRA